jgi:two-component system chemotaxis response regulator CheB
MRLARTPTQNRNRPAIDVTFRSAAVAYDSSVVGVLLSGLLDDGRAGLASIKACGGVRVVQDPADALFPAMPRAALESVAIDHCLPADEIAPLLVRLAPERVEAGRAPPHMLELQALADRGGNPHERLGTTSPFACPECHGVLWESAQQGQKHYRCRIGHAYSEQTLASLQDQATEDALWAAVRSLEERSNLARCMAAEWRARQREQLAKELERKAQRGEEHAARFSDMLLTAFRND